MGFNSAFKELNRRTQANHMKPH